MIEFIVTDESLNALEGRLNRHSSEVRKTTSGINVGDGELLAMINLIRFYKTFPEASIRNT